MLALSLAGAFSALADNNPKADDRAMVVAGNARFTVLTDRLIRMEWSEGGAFEDNATLAIVNRNLPVPAFSVKRSGDAVTIKTDRVTLSYTGEGRFDGSNLSVSFKMNGKKVTWTPDSEATGNLKGTNRTLDMCEGPNVELETGILSRDGWSIVDESSRHILKKDGSDWGEWVDVRPEKDVQDLYIFAYGHDYTGALSDFTKIAGKIPMVPKYVFGYWWSRYWPYSDQEFLTLASDFRSRQIPIDIMIIDMEWHQTWPNLNSRIHCDDFGQGVGWTGYSWNKDLIPDPEGLLSELHNKYHLKTSLNIHPASGVLSWEDAYPDFVADYISRTDDYDGPEGYVYSEGDKMFDGTPAKAGYHANVPWRMDQQAWADAYFNSVIHPIEKMGIDFWWLDWQQWRDSKYVPGLSNTFWINYAFFNDKVRANRGKSAEDSARPMIYHRWGGLGSHRYPLGFSGDTYIEWAVLGYLPYFTATASNVCYGYWGHDVGGHMQKIETPTNPELFTRWLQYGVFTPIYKTHYGKYSKIERRIWMFPDHYKYMKDAIDLRYALTPYIYDASRQAYDTGVSICRPLYYYYPENEKAYSSIQEYMFGDNILAAPVCTPMNTETGLSEQTVWFPGGNDWYDMAHRNMIKGGSTRALSYTIGENAWFVKAGSIIPLAEAGIQNLQETSNALRLYIAPGSGKASYSHYEDDGISQAYDKQYATTLITKSSDKSACTLTVGPRVGEYAGMPQSRKLTVILGGLSRNIKKVSLNGNALESSYDPDTKEATIELPESDASQEIKLNIKY